MQNKNIAKSYPELMNYAPDKQHEIFERALKEIEKDGKSLFWGTRLILTGALIGVICAAILFLASKGNNLFTLIAAIVIVMVFILLVQNRNRSVIQPKVSEIIQKDKFNTEINPTGR